MRSKHTNVVKKEHYWHCLKQPAFGCGFPTKGKNSTIWSGLIKKIEGRTAIFFNFKIHGCIKGTILLLRVNFGRTDLPTQSWGTNLPSM